MCIGFTVLCMFAVQLFLRMASRNRSLLRETLMKELTVSSTEHMMKCVLNPMYFMQC